MVFVSTTGVLRERIRLTAADVDAAWATLPDFPPQVVDGATDIENLLSVEEDLEDVNTTLDIFEAHLGVLFGSHQQWDTVVNRLDGRDRAAEVELREAFERDEVSLTQMLHDVQEKIHAWKKQRSALEKLKRRFERKVEEAERVEERDARAAAAAERRDARSSQIKLPSIDLPKYDGSILDFQEWWDLYSGSIDNNAALDSRQKFAYLKSYLTGRAGKAIAGIQETAANYATAKKIILEEFGNKNLLKDVLYVELESLKRPDEKAASLREFKSDLERVCRQLENLGEDLQHENILGILQRKLPRSVVNDYVKKRKEKPTWSTKDLRDFLAEAVEEKDAVARVLGPGLEASGGKGQQISASKPKSSKSSDRTAVYTPCGAFAATTSKKRSKPECFLCGKDHLTINCTTFPDVQSRRDRASQASLCYRCLQPGHARRRCTNTRNCSHCKKDSHHSCLCPDMLPADKRSTQTPRPRSNRREQRGKAPKDQYQNRRAAAAAQAEPAEAPTDSRQRPESPKWITSSPIVTASVDPQLADDVQGASSLLTKDTKVRNPDTPSKEMSTTLFFDTGSDLSFCSKEIASTLGLKKIGSRMLRLKTFGATKPQKMRLDRHILEVPLKDGTKMALVVYATKDLIGEVPAVQVKPVAEPRADGGRWMLRVKNVEPQVLIGNSDYWDFALTEIDRLKDGTRIIDSVLGSMATGRGRGITLHGCPIINECSALPSISVDGTTYITRRELDKNVERFWLLEALGFMEDPRIRDDDVAQQILLRTLRRVGDRYEVGMPWIHEKPRLSNTYRLAWKRLANLLARLRRDPELLKRYDAIIQQQIRDGVLEIVENPDDCDNPYYLPHHAVFSKDKTTKLRIVLDASAKCKGELSLNDNLYRGPVLLPHIASLGLRSRTGEVVVMGDIEKAYHTISIPERDRDAFRMLWLKDITKGLTKDNLFVLRAARVIFGAKPSSFLLSGTIQEHLRRSGTPLAEEILENTYSDNVVLMCDTPEEAIAKTKETDSLFEQAGMNLRGYVSNSSVVNVALGSTDLPPINRFLGLWWKIATDEFLLRTPVTEVDELLTMRQVLSQLAQPYDPHGLLTPVVFQAKAHFQKIFKEVGEWDAKVPADLREQWRAITSQWGHVELAVRRHIVRNKASRFELHGTTDASALGCGAAIYLREISPDGSITCHLLFGKSRLAPIKDVPTIPRLELIAFVLCLRALLFVACSLRMQFARRAIWCDSRIAIGWLSRDLATLPLFIKNRVLEFRKHPDLEIGYVSTTENPADAASRGLSLMKLRDHPTWWNGPSWMQKDEASWPHSCIAVKTLEDSAPEEEEDTVLTTTAAIAVDARGQTPVFDTSRLSSFSRTRNSAICMLRTARKFLSLIGMDLHLDNGKCLAMTARAERNAQECILARHFLVKQDQARQPPTEEQVAKWGLRPNHNGILVTNDRLAYSGLPEETKHCVFLPRGSPLLELIILMLHAKHNHSSAQNTLSVLRQTYWTPRGRQVVRWVIKRRCMECRRRNARAYKAPVMPPLPKYRTDRAPAFAHVGLDYLGPINIRWTWKQEGKLRSDPVKVWVLLVTCMSTRAVALEIVHDLTAESFILALRRFIADHGKPRLITSDNATNFTLAAKVLNSCWNPANLHPDIRAYLNSEEMRWIFIPANSPWRGGFYERLVASVKKAFAHGAGRRVLEYQEAHTTIKEVASILNHRPLTYLYDDTDMSILRPVDLIRPENNPPTGVYFDDDGWSDDETYHPRLLDSQAKAKRWYKGSLKTVALIWERLYPDVLMSLRERMQNLHAQGHTANVQPQLDEVVLIQKTNLKQFFWPTGRIVGLNESHDKEVRTAEVQLPNGNVITRSLQHLHPLEINARDDEALQVAESEPPSDRPMSPQPGRMEAEVNDGVGSLEMANDEPRQSSRYHLRPRKAIDYVYATLLVVLMAQAGMAATLPSFAGMKPKPSTHPGRICTTSNPTFAVSSERCVNTGLVLNRDMVDGKLCFAELSCPPGQHVTQQGSRVECAQACRCEQWWSFGCSHYHGKATALSHIGNRDVRRVLQEMAPAICSLKPTAKCTVPEPSRLFQVALFDNSTHFVNSLNLVHEDFNEQDIQCVGEGRLVSGSPKFCEMHHCFDNATRLCFHTYAERVYLQGKSGEVLVKSWGAVETVVYVEEHVQRDKANSTFRIDCLPYGFLVTASRDRVRYQLCSGGLCVEKGNPRTKEEITFPPEYLMRTHLAQLTVWEKGQEIAAEEIECPGRAICEQIQCDFCRALIRNPQCFNPATVAGALIVVYVLLFGLFLACLKRATLKRASPTTATYTPEEDPNESTSGIELPEINRRTAEERPLTRQAPPESPPTPPSRIAPAPPLPPRSSESAPLQNTVNGNDEVAESQTEGYEQFHARRAPATHDLRGTDAEYVYARQCPDLAQVVYDNARLKRVGRTRRTPKTDTILATSTLGLVACLTILVPHTHGCSKTHDVVASTQMCYTQQNGGTVCYYDQVITLTVGDTDRHICVTLRDPQTRPLGTAIVDVSGVELVCLRKPVYHTRQFVINVASSKRCYRAGSCYSNMCELTTSSTLVPELAAANEKPGITYCRNAAGCWANGCWYCVDACLYFRAYAASTTSRVGEVFECKWRPRLRIAVTLQQLGQELKQGTFEVVEAQTATQGDVSITVSSISLPPMPPADQRFVKDGKRVAIVDRDHRRVLQCDSERDAANLNGSCRLLFNPCSCGPAGNVAVCDCPRHESVMDALDEEDSVLPRHVGGVWLTNNQSILLAEADYTGAQIDLSLHNFRMEVKVENNSCEITPLHVTGCRQCNKGATFEYICKTDFGSALADVRCETTQFHAHCDRQGQPNRHHFVTDKKLLRESCTVSCPQGESEFLLEATLATIAPEDSSLRHTAGLENSSEFHWSDVAGFLGDTASFIWNSILMFDVKIWLVTAVVIVLASIALLGGFRYLEHNHPDLLRLLLLAVVVPMTCTSTLPASNHATGSPQGTVIAPGFITLVMQLTPSLSVMSRKAPEFAGLELVDEVDDRHADSDLLDEDLDEQVLDYDEGNQAVLNDDDAHEVDDESTVTGEAGGRRSQRCEAGAELRPPLMLASRIVVPPSSRPAPPPVLSSIVVCNKYKQVNDSTKSCFEPNSICDRETAGHERCGHIQLRDLDNGASKDLRYRYIRTPLQYAFVLHALRGAYGHRKNAFLRQLLCEAPDQAIDVYERFRTERATVKDTVRSTDMFQAYTERFKSCRPANAFLKTDTTKAIWFRSKIADHIENAEEQNRLRSLLATSYEALQKIRIKYCHPGKTLLNCNTIIIGDDLAKDMHRHMKLAGSMLMFRVLPWLPPR